MVKSGNIVFNQLENSELHDASITLRAIAHPLRLKILSYIDKNDPVNVHDIFSNLNLDQSVTSQQLNILRASNLVKTNRKGKFIFYSLNYENIARINALVEGFKK